MENPYFYGISLETFEKVKQTSVIDYVYPRNCLFLIQNFLIVNCQEGIAFISVNTKQLIQYYQIFDFSYNRRICLNENNKNIYILNNENYSIIKMELSEGTFIVKDFYKITEMEKAIYNKDKKHTNRLIIPQSLGTLEIIFNRGFIFLYRDEYSYFLLKEKK